jgi:hypothetical protein
MTFNKEEAIKFIQDNLEVPNWVVSAREKHNVYKALVHGDNFHDVLIDKIEHLESKPKASARKKYSKDIRDLFHRVFNKRHNVFEANGGSEHISIENKNIKELFLRYSSNFKANKSIFEYLSNYYYSLVDTDPNGLIFIEYKVENDIVLELEPCYKSIKNIRSYESNGQLCKWVLFEPEHKEDSKSKIWRLVDDVTDWTIIENSGVFIIDESKTFNHPFGSVPCLILSEKEKIGSQERLSPITPIIELAKDYARDKSILTIYKFQNGFPVHYRFGSQLKSDTGVNKTGANSANDSDSKGNLQKIDVTDINFIPMPREGQPLLNNLGGFMQPDLKTWGQYKTDLKDFEDIIYDTIWGTTIATQKTKTDKTATEVFVDVQPVNNVLNGFSNTVEYMHNVLANLILNFVDVTKDKEKTEYFITYGRRYILESPDVILDRYQLSKEKGDNNTILDKILEEFVLSKYKTDPLMRDIMIKKIKIEPYVHLDIKSVFDMFGIIEAQSKILFQKFWETIDISKNTEQLKTEFKNYLKNESMQPLPITV